MSAPGAAAGAITCQPSSRVQFCHCTASAASTSAMAGLAVVAGDCVCAPSDQARSRLMVQARTNSFGEFLDIIRFLERCHGEDVAIVLFEVDLQLFGQVRQFGGVLEVLLMFRLEDLIFLRLAVGQDDVVLLIGAAPA